MRPFDDDEWSQAPEADPVEPWTDSTADASGDTFRYVDVTDLQAPEADADDEPEQPEPTILDGETGEEIAVDDIRGADLHGEMQRLHMVVGEHDDSVYLSDGPVESCDGAMIRCDTGDLIDQEDWQ